MIVSIIAAIGKNRVIGNDNNLPWRLPADMKRFRKLTLGKQVVMGQRTFESIGKALPGRTNIVLSNNPGFRAKDCLVAHSLEEALNAAKEEEVMIVGGESVYKQFLPLADRMYLTLIDEEFAGDAYFPEYNSEEWEEKERRDCQPDDKNPYNYAFVTLQRRKI